MGDISQAVAKGASGVTMAGFQIVDAVTSGIPLKTVIAPGSEYQAKFPTLGNLAYRFVLNTDLSLTIDAGELNNQFQKLTFVIQQPPSGNCLVSISGINWINNKPPFIDSRTGSFTFFEIFKFNELLIGNFIGEVINNG